MVAIADIDTRRLTRILREKGAQNGCIMAGEDVDEAAALAAGAGFPRPEGHGSGQGGHDATSLRLDRGQLAVGQGA